MILRLNQELRIDKMETMEQTINALPSGNIQLSILSEKATTPSTREKKKLKGVDESRS